MQRSPDSGADIREVRQVLDSALFRLRAIEDPALNLRPVHDALGEAIRHTYEAMRQTGDYAGFKQCSDNALAQARTALTGLQATRSDDMEVERTMGLVAHSLGQLRNVRLVISNEPAPIPPPDGPAKATVGRPTVQRPPRAAVPAAIPLADLGDPPPDVGDKSAIPAGINTIEGVEALIAAAKSLAEEMDGEPEDDRDADDRDKEAGELEVDGPPPHEVLFGLGVAERDLLLAQAGELMGDLGMMGRMRMPEDEHSWLHGDETERRLLARVDALVACGAWVIPRFVSELGDSPIPDAPLTWGLIFLLGSLDGQDSLDEIFRILETCDFEDEHLGEELIRYAANALALAPHHGIVQRLRPWLQDHRDPRRIIAAEALSQRKALSVNELHHLAGDATTRIAEIAAKGLGLLEGPLPVGTFARMLHDDRPEVLRAAISSALRHRQQSPVDRALELFTEDMDPALEVPHFIAITTDRDTGYQAFMAAGKALDSIEVVTALGWFGHLGFIEFLIGRLDSETPGVAMAAVGALERITGARMLAEDSDPEYAEQDLPFLREWAPPIVIPDPCLDSEAWGDWWKKHRGNAQMDKRYRYGHLWEPRDCLWALGDEITTIAEREFVHRELCVRTGGTYGLEPDRFCVPQLALVQLWADHVQRSCRDIQPGSWPTRFGS